MASIAIGDDRGHGGRAVNHELPLVPFIDFLLCLIAFLLVTAVWSQMARLSANAMVPGQPDLEPTEPQRTLHLELRSPERFQLVWRDGATVVDTIDVARRAVPIGDQGDYKYPELAQALEREWTRRGVHRAPTDLARDRVVLHVGNAVAFEEMAAVLDAIHEPARSVTARGMISSVPAFSAAFAVD
ncbi:MAG: biopolymer transporter ExbD [Polyangiaceae bacterium]|nr:biopolymer transporter ExbD [Polyangiaceae bacterium]